MRTIQEQAIESAGKLLMDYGINPPGGTCDDPACDAHLNIRVRAAIERIEASEARAAALEQERDTLSAQLATVTKERDALYNAGVKFSRAHSNSAEDDPRVDPQDWFEFDSALGILP